MQVGGHFLCVFSSIIEVIIGQSVFCVSRFQSQIPLIFIVRIFESMERVIHFGFLGHFSVLNRHS